MPSCPSVAKTFVLEMFVLSGLYAKIVRRFKKFVSSVFFAIYRMRLFYIYGFKIVKNSELVEAIRTETPVL